MAFSFDEIFAYGGQLIVAAKKVVPNALGVGLSKINHSTYIQGNTQIGKPDAFSDATATLMVGREDTAGTDRSVYVNGNQFINGDSATRNALYVTGGSGPNSVYIDGDLYVTGSTDTGNKGRLASRFGAADGRPKPFDIKHPSKDGWRLRCACIEGPEVAVYYRGRLKESNVINLPDYWKDLVHADSITVQLQPIGRQQNLIVEEFDNEYIVIAEDLTNTDLITDLSTIDCFYHVYGERKDVERLIVEYQGTSTNDYPGDNSIYSINR